MRLESTRLHSEDDEWGREYPVGVFCCQVVHARDDVTAVFRHIWEGVRLRQCAVLCQETGAPHFALLYLFAKIPKYSTTLSKSNQYIFFFLNFITSITTLTVFQRTHNFFFLLWTTSMDGWTEITIRNGIVRQTKFKCSNSDIEIMLISLLHIYRCTYMCL